MSLDQLHSLPPAQQQAILNGPALAPPAGVVPNLDNPPNGNALCIGIIAFLLILATSAFTLAAYVKLFYVKKLYLEDFSCILSIISHFGLFVHQWNVRVKDLAGILYLVHVGSELYAVIIVLFKTAILLEWWTCYILLGTNVVFYTVILISANATCKPFAKLWDKTLPGDCSDNNAFDVATASYNFVSDVFILLLPQRLIWRLHLKTKAKVGIAFIFAVGISACVAAAYRLYASIEYLEMADITYGIADIALGTEAEIVCAMLVFWVPTLPKAFRDVRNLFRRLASVFSRQKGSTGTATTSSHPDFNGQVESGLPHPREAYVPNMSILRTTQVSINGECDHESIPQHLEDARRC
ncbi:hypothetical protein EKO27_g6021 [Xylaria grammica]|uniref:Rhodopsin domain-containing protein n=1 Tax=Xylaria grammica TaxID=363999 RepID=A0A439D3V4_9PEZI|nr:hypothetical protein EKO27_g6021 [Xylaria grammica]